MIVESGMEGLEVLRLESMGGAVVIHSGEIDDDMPGGVLTCPGPEMRKESGAGL